MSDEIKRVLRSAGWLATYDVIARRPQPDGDEQLDIAVRRRIGGRLVGCMLTTWTGAVYLDRDLRHAETVLANRRGDGMIDLQRAVQHLVAESEAHPCSWSWGVWGAQMSLQIQVEIDGHEVGGSIRIGPEDDPGPLVARFVEDVRRTRMAVAEDNRAIECAPRLIDTLCLTVLARILGDAERAVALCLGPSGPATARWIADPPRLLRATEVTAIPPLGTSNVNIRGGRAWLHASEKEHGIGVKGGTIRSMRSGGLPETMANAVAGALLDDVLRHPLTTGAGLRIDRGWMSGNGGYRRLNLQMDRRHVGPQEALRIARESLETRP